jgi:hypothetical protein
MLAPISTRDITDDGLECERLLENSTDDSAKMALVICTLRDWSRGPAADRESHLPVFHYRFGASSLPPGRGRSPGPKQ